MAFLGKIYVHNPSIVTVLRGVGHLLQYTSLLYSYTITNSCKIYMQPIQFSIQLVDCFHYRVRPQVTISDPSPLKSITKQQPHTSSLKYHGNTSSGLRKQGATGRRETGGVARRIRGRDGVEPSSSGGAVSGDSKRTVKSVTRNRFPDTLTLPALVCMYIQ